MDEQRLDTIIQQLSDIIGQLNTKLEEPLKECDDL